MRWRPFPFRIVTRILLFNALIVFLPIASVLLLDTHERQLLNALERTLVQQARVIAAALSIAPELDAGTATELLGALRRQHEARLRILDADGRLLADSSAPGSPRPVAQPPETVADAKPLVQANPRQSPLYRIASFPVRTLRALTRPETPLSSADFYTRAAYASGSEVQAALAGRYGAATRVSAGGQISVTLYSALPIERSGSVAGVVLVSQSTFRILQDLYQIRIDVFRVFLWSLGAAVVLSAFLAITIARPISILQRRTREVVDEHGRLTRPFPRGRRRDEIGALSRSLADLTDQIGRYMRGLETFAADASHELKNPLASIAANCEMALTTRDDARREKLLTRARLDVRRAESIIAAMRRLSHIDARLDPPGRCALNEAVAAAVADLTSRYPKHAIVFDPRDGGRCEVPVSEDRVFQLLANLVENAAGYAPPGTAISVRTAARDGERAVELIVMDEGPGFEEPDRVFDRFYTSRAERDGHLGLGLSIVQSIVESAGGRVEAYNRSDGCSGACVMVLIPVV